MYESKHYQYVKPVEDGESANQPTVFRIQVEQLRFIAYMAFWGMCIFAMVVSTFAVAPSLGPCPLTPGAEPTYGMHCSVLMATFGFNNVSLHLHHCYFTIFSVLCTN